MTRSILNIFIILAIVVVSVNIWQSLKTKTGFFQTPKYLKTEKIFKKKPTQPKTQPQPLIKTKTVIKSSKPNVLINTEIVSGPKPGEIITDTNEVVFEFKAIVSPKKTKGKILFETKLEGIDHKWILTSSNKRKIKLPKGSKEYKFLVRAKINDIVDPTPAERAFRLNISPYFKKVKIYSVRYKTSSHPSLITLSSALDKEEKINITNWKIKASKGEIIIPQASNKYPPYNIIPVGDIFVKQYHKVYLSAGSNPLAKNKNFRLNKCFGYFLNYKKIYPSFLKICPKPKLEEISHLNQYCQEFILDLPRCKIPDYSRNPKIASNSQCVSYLKENFNYRGCFRKYSSDKDFLKPYWYIYLNQDIVSKLHDTLYLYDQNGLIVDKYSY
ncbi:hypothetical protein DRN73_07180 [Candidatus Pacearchaeota archaeon]|nr:MAG: hypothetical protein DRN73_07180 [Candidatus Pacearchaeota archaeon]